MAPIKVAVKAILLCTALAACGSADQTSGNQGSNPPNQVPAGYNGTGQPVIAGFSNPIPTNSFTSITAAPFAPSPLTIVSDLDDTLKITNTNNTVSAVFHAIGSNSGFAGMPQLVNALLHNATSAGSARFYIVSGSPGVLSSKVRSFLSGNGYPQPARIFLKDGTYGKDTMQHKLGAIAAIMNEAQGPYLFLGDDTQQDAEVYQQVAQQLGNRALGVYIHQIEAKGVSGSQEKPFVTAFDMGLQEYASGRIQRAQLVQIGQAILGTGDLELLIPGFVKCQPQPPITVTGDSELTSMAHSIQQKVQQACES